MKSKYEKHMDALERREAQLLAECEFIANNFSRYGSPSRDLIFYLTQVNNVRRVIPMPTLSISSYDAHRGVLVITDGYTQLFYPREN